MKWINARVRELSTGHGTLKVLVAIGALIFTPEQLAQFQEYVTLGVAWLGAHGVIDITRKESEPKA